MEKRTLLLKERWPLRSASQVLLDMSSLGMNLINIYESKHEMS